MTHLLKQSTAITIQMGPALDKDDGVTPETGLSPTIYVSKNGAAQTTRSSGGAISHDRDGWYRVPLDATDTGTLGRLKAQFTSTGTHLPVWHEFTVVPANVYDSLVAGSDNLETDVILWRGTQPNTLVSNRVDVSVGAMASAVITATAIASNAITSTKIADGAITAAKLASNAITSAKIAAGAIASGVIASAELNNIADAILKRDWTSVSGEAARSALNALRFLRNKWSVSGSTLTVTEEDDTTSAWTSTITTDAAADPVTASDPD